MRAGGVDLSALRSEVRARRAGASGRSPLAEPEPAASPATPPDAARLAAAVARADPELARRLAALDPWQQDAVVGLAPGGECGGECVVDAHVGSGKTTVLAARAAWLHRVEGVPTERIVALTFTTRAAAAIADALGIHRFAAGQRVGTFHAVAYALLLEARAPGAPPCFVLGEEERLERLERLIASEGLSMRARTAARKIDRGQLPDLAARERDEPGLTFDALLDAAHELVTTTPLEPPPAWVLVDELQDCTPRELALVEALRDAGARLFAVGDPHQAIYGWRGSNPSRTEGWRRARELPARPLPTCYRCQGAILELARQLLPSGAPPLVASRPPGEAPTLIEHHDTAAEAAYLAGRLPGLSGSVSVLARTRRQLIGLSEALERRGVRTHLAVRPTARDLPAPYFALRLLRAALLDDVDSARYVLAHPNYGVLKKAPLVDRLDDLRDALPTRRSRHVDPALAHRLIDDLASLRAAPPTDPDDLIARAHLVDLLRPTAPSHARDLAHLRRWLAHWMAQAVTTSLATVVARASIEGPAPARPTPGLPQLMTIHAAKGLEFDHVVVSGVNEGRLPMVGEDDPLGLSEERRLLYVAVTRARETLQLSWHTAPDDPRVESRPSCFLDRIRLAAPELPPPADDSPTGWTVGQAVRHARYGDGEITRADADTVVARFGALGEKSFHPALCPLEVR